MPRTRLATARAACIPSTRCASVPDPWFRLALPRVLTHLSLLALSLPLWASPPTAPLAAEVDTLVICDNPRPADAETKAEADDCVEFGAAVGQLGLSWRQQLPGKVRWLMRRDATDLCQKNRSEFGERTSTLPKEGCIFVTEQACTIVTARAASHAELGNAVRSCQP